MHTFVDATDIFCTAATVVHLVFLRAVSYFLTVSFASSFFFFFFPPDSAGVHFLVGVLVSFAPENGV